MFSMLTIGMFISFINLIIFKYTKYWNKYYINTNLIILFFSYKLYFIIKTRFYLKEFKKKIIFIFTKIFIKKN